MLPILRMRKPDLYTVIPMMTHLVEGLLVSDKIFPGFEIDIVVPCLLSQGWQYITARLGYRNYYLNRRTSFELYKLWGSETRNCVGGVIVSSRTTALRNYYWRKNRYQ